MSTYNNSNNNGSGSGNGNVQKYYKKSVGAGGIGVGASLYKENKIGRHVWMTQNGKFICHDK